MNEIRTNELIIAERDLRIYLGECDLLFQAHDQIFIKAIEPYKDKLTYIANIKRGVGILLIKDYRGKKDQPQYKTETIQTLNKRNGRLEPIKCYILGLTKDPSLFMYTDEQSAIDKEELKEKKAIKD